MALEREIKTFDAHRADLLSQEGRFVVIHKDCIVGTFETYADAIQAGYQVCQLEPFLVKRIQANDQVQYFTRDIRPCRT